MTQATSNKFKVVLPYDTVNKAANAIDNKRMIFWEEFNRTYDCCYIKRCLIKAREECIVLEFNSEEDALWFILKWS